MATIIDRRVVEIRFDNSDFERNTRQTMSTLDKLKAKLNFNKVPTGFENIQKSANKLNFNPISDSLLAIQNRFSTMGIVGMTVIQNLTNSLLGFAKKAADFSIGGIISGGYSRASKIENARFQLKGLLKDLEAVEDVMKDVDYGVTDTAYGLDAAATVAAQLVASGIKAGDEMKHALRGISGVAAMTNSSYEDIGRIYTTIAGNGRLMGEQLLQLSSRGMNAAAILGKAMGKSEAEIREMVTKGKISFKQFSTIMDETFGEHAKEANATFNGVISNIKSALARIGELFFKPIIAENSPLIQFLNSIRYRINEIKNNLVPVLSDITKRVNAFFTAIDKTFNSNNVLGFNPLSKLSTTLNGIKDAMNGVLQPAKEAVKVVESVNDKLKDYNTIAKEVINGKWKNGHDRVVLLTEAGYNYAKAQNLVNEKLGSSVRIDERKYESLKDTQKAQEQTVETTQELAKSIDQMSDQELRNIGMTDEQIEALNELKEMAKKTGIPLKELIDILSTETKDRDGNLISAFSTRFLIFNSFKNIGITLVTVLKSIAKAFTDVFAIKPDWLFDMVAGFHKLTVELREGITERADKITRTFKGLFSVIKLVASILGGGLKIAVTIFKTVFETLGYDILDITATLGDWVTYIVDVIVNNNVLIKGIVWLTKTISNAIIKIHDFVKGFFDFKEIASKLKETLKGIITYLKDIGKKGLSVLIKDLQKFFDGFKNVDNIPKYIFESFVKGIKKYGGIIWNAIKTFFTNVTDNISKKFKVDKGGNFFEFGVNCVKGLINGLKSGAGNAVKAFAEWASKILSAFAEKLGIHSPSTVFFDFGKNIVQGLYNGIVTAIGIVYELVTTIGYKLIEMIKGLDLGALITSALAGAALFGIYKIASTIAKALDTLSNGLQAINGLIIEAGRTLAVFKSVLKVARFKIIASAVKDIAISVAILVASVIALSFVDGSKLAKAMLTLTGIMVLLGALSVAILLASSKLGLVDTGKIALIFIGLGAGLLLMAMAFKKIAKLKDINIDAIGTFALMIAGMLGLVYILTKFSSANVTLAAGTILAIGAMFLIMAKVVKYFGKMHPSDLKQGLVALGAIAGIIIELIAVIAMLNMIPGGEMSKIGGTLAAVGLVFLAMATVTKMLGKMNPQQLFIGITAVKLFTYMIIGLIASLRIIAGNDISKIGGTLAACALLIGVMSLTVLLLGRMSMESIVKGEAAVFAFCAMIVGLIASLKFIAGENIAQIGLTLLGMSALIAAMALSTALLGMIEIGKLAKGIIAVGLLAAIMAGLIKVANSTGNSYKRLIVLTVALGVMVLSVALLSMLDPKKLIAPVAALTLLMTAFGIMVKLAKGATQDKKALASIILMTGIVILLAGVVALLAQLDPSSVLDTVLSLSILLIAMSASLRILGKMNVKDLAVGMLGLLAITGVLLALMLVITGMGKVKNAVPIINALSIFMVSMAALLLIVAATGAIYAASGGTALLGLVGLLAMIPFLTGILLMLLGASALMSLVPGMDKNLVLITNILNTMIKMLTPLAAIGPLALTGVVALYGLMQLMGPMIIFATLLGALMEYIPDLEAFLNKGMQVMIDIAGGLGEMIGAFVKGALVQISAALPEIGMNLSRFMVNATPFLLGCNMVTKQHLAAVGILTGCILALTAAQLISGIVKFISLGQDFSTLGTSLTNFAENSQGFFEIISTIPAAAMNGIKALSEAILTLTAANLLNGLTKFIGMGSSSLAQFGTLLGPIGANLALFVGNLGVFSEEQVTTVECAGKAIKALADAASKIPNDGGLWDVLFGGNSLASFADAMPSVGEGVAGFVEKLGKFSKEQIESANAAAKIVTAMAKAAEACPKDSGVWQYLFGENSLIKFASAMPLVGEAVNDFVKKLTNVEGKEKAAQSASSIIKAIADMAKNKNLAKFDSKKAAKVITDVGKGIADFHNKLKDISEEDISSDAGKLTAITNAVKTMVNVIDTSFKDNTGKIVTSAETLAKKAAKGMTSKDVLDELKKQGKNFVQGLADGISNNSSLAENAAKKVAQKALEASKKKLDEHSPSKETRKQGEYFTEGFIIGISEYSSRVYKVSEDVANEAKSGLSSAIAKIANLVDSDMDVNPTIKPVLDLSEVSEGANYINSMFGNPSMQLAANLSSINNGMNNRNQNGNSDIISAINKLSNSLGENSGNTYNINGVTYDDSSSINQAVQDLVRAVGIERRV